MFNYAISPIDHGWEFCDTVSEYAAKIAKSELVNSHLGYDGSFGKFILSFKEAQRCARDSYWEGDFVEEARVFQVPADNSFEYGFAWKQKNNGTTFVISPVELPHLEDYIF